MAKIRLASGDIDVAYRYFLYRMVRVIFFTIVCHLRTPLLGIHAHLSKIMSYPLILLLFHIWFLFFLIFPGWPELTHETRDLPLGRVNPRTGFNNYAFYTWIKWTRIYSWCFDWSSKLVLAKIFVISLFIISFYAFVLNFVIGSNKTWNGSLMVFTYWSILIRIKS